MLDAGMLPLDPWVSLLARERTIRRPAGRVDYCLQAGSSRSTAWFREVQELSIFRIKGLLVDYRLQAARRQLYCSVWEITNFADQIVAVPERIFPFELLTIRRH
jgi:hypothetical protein